MTNKYQREIKPGVFADVYDILNAWNVTNPALSHLIKKALQPGERGHKDLQTDLDDIVASALRARELEFPVSVKNDVGWNKWHGGVCPVDLFQMVTVKKRNGDVICQQAGGLTWGRWVGETDTDIIAWREAGGNSIECDFKSASCDSQVLDDGWIE